MVAMRSCEAWLYGLPHWTASCRGRGRYYAAMVLNLLGRVSWSVAVSPAFCTADCTLTLELLEIFRRCMWLLFRVEHEFIETSSQRDQIDGTALALLSETNAA